MNKPQYYFLSCDSFRLSCEPQSVHARKGIVDCELTMVAYPAAWWFDEIPEYGIAAILNRFETDAPGDREWSC